jgi:hypothetical protein
LDGGLSLHGTILTSSHGQKTVKPQFFESFRLEKANAALLGTATEHMSRQAVAISTAVADGERADGPPWGGLSSKTILAAEVVPMALKIQRLSQSKSESYTLCYCCCTDTSLQRRSFLHLSPRSNSTPTPAISPAALSWVPLT